MAAAVVQPRCLQRGANYLGVQYNNLNRLSSSTGLHSTKVDLVITAYDRSPSVTAIDVTISCPLLPTYSSSAATSATHIFDARALEKNDKHLAGSIAQGRTFLPVVFTTLGGIGPPEAVHYLDALFSDSYASELAATGSTRNTAHARRLFYQSLLATLTKATADMASALTIAAFEASAADASSATNPAFPPDLTPSNADADHSDDAEF